MAMTPRTSWFQRFKYQAAPTVGTATAIVFSPMRIPGSAKRNGAGLQRQVGLGRNLLQAVIGIEAGFVSSAARIPKRSSTAAGARPDVKVARLVPWPADCGAGPS